jgi:hypothetical protein
MSSIDLEQIYQSVLVEESKQLAVKMIQDEVSRKLHQFLAEKNLTQFLYGKESISHNDTTFQYQMCCRPDGIYESVFRVKFNISRYGKHQHVLEFETPVTMAKAVQEVEKYLSVPLTEEYYNTVKDDLFANLQGWDDVHDSSECRGDLLSSCTYLEAVEINDEGTMEIFCGS